MEPLDRCAETVEWHEGNHDAGLHDVNAPKKPTNVSINEDLVRIAKAYGINLSSIAEQALAEAVREKVQQSWLAENAKAIDEYNRHIDARGVFSDGLRRF